MVPKDNAKQTRSIAAFIMVIVGSLFVGAGALEISGSYLSMWLCTSGRSLYIGCPNYYPLIAQGFTLSAFGTLVLILGLVIHFKFKQRTLSLPPQSETKH